jgi:hypothetical protein
MISRKLQSKPLQPTNVYSAHEKSTGDSIKAGEALRVGLDQNRECPNLHFHSFFKMALLILASYALFEYVA